MTEKFRYKPTRFKADDSVYNKQKADLAVGFIEHLCHTKGTWNGKKFELLPWQEQIIRDLFGIIKPNGYRQFNTAYIEIPKKNGKSELAAAYPFWYKACTVVGKLFSMQDKISSSQIYGRMKDCYGDRETIARNTRYAIRTMVSWGFLQDSADRRGFYEKGPVFEITNKKIATLLLEGVVLSMPEERAEVNDLNQSSGLFGFSHEFISGAMLSDLTKKRLSYNNFDTSNTFVSVNAGKKRGS